MKTGFSDDQYRCAYPDGIENHWWHLARSRIVAHTIRTLSGPNAAVIEVGCGRGIVVKDLRDAGIDCNGVELAMARPLASIDRYVRVGIDATDLSSEEKQRYDTLLLLDVIEHVPDPVTLLQSLVDAFPKLAHIIITAPGRQELWSNYDDFYGHYRRYTIEALKSLTAELPLTLAWESYFFHLAYFPLWAASALKGNRGTAPRPPRGASRVAHKLISCTMILDYYMFPRWVPGTSVLACFSVDKSLDQQRTPPDAHRNAEAGRRDGVVASSRTFD